MSVSELLTGGRHRKGVGHSHYARTALLRASSDPSAKWNKIPAQNCEAGEREWDCVQFRYIIEVLAVFVGDVEVGVSSSHPSPSYFTHSHFLRWNPLDGHLTPKVNTFPS